MLEDQSSPAADALSLLESDLANEETSFPVLEAGVVDFVISEASLKETEKKNGFMLNLRMKTSIPWKTLKGEVKQSGFPMRHGIFIPHVLPNGENAESVKMAKSKLAQLKEAVLGTKEGGFGKPEQYVGRPVTARINAKARKDNPDEMQNEVVAFVKRT